MNRDTPTDQTRSMTHGWMQGGSFLSSILAGTALGYLADMWLETEPWLVVVGALAGSYSGFLHLWRWAKEVEDVRRQA